MAQHARSNLPPNFDTSQSCADRQQHYAGRWQTTVLASPAFPVDAFYCADAYSPPVLQSYSSLPAAARACIERDDLTTVLPGHWQQTTEDVAVKSNFLFDILNGDWERESVVSTWPRKEGVRLAGCSSPLSSPAWRYLGDADVVWRKPLHVAGEWAYLCMSCEQLRSGEGQPTVIVRDSWKFWTRWDGSSVSFPSSDP